MLRRAGREFTFEDEGAESLDIVELKDWEQRLIHSKNSPEEQAMDDDWGYGGNGTDEDGF
jgi:hypothetical protein